LYRLRLLVVVTLKKNESIVVVATLALIFYALTLSVISQVTSSLQSNRTMPSVGEVKAIGVGIYWDQSCTTEVSSIEWGVLEPGSSKNVTVYIRNEGNSAANLTMNTSNWNPANASDYIDLSWDYQGQVINVNEVLEVTFTLIVSSEIQGITSFSFDIIIVGSG
jgi:hypothetical protein